MEKCCLHSQNGANILPNIPKSISSAYNCEFTIPICRWICLPIFRQHSRAESFEYDSFILNDCCGRRVHGKWCAKRKHRHPEQIQVITVHPSLRRAKKEHLEIRTTRVSSGCICVCAIRSQYPSHNANARHLQRTENEIYTTSISERLTRSGTIV